MEFEAQALSTACMKNARNKLLIKTVASVRVNRATDVTAGRPHLHLITTTIYLLVTRCRVIVHASSSSFRKKRTWLHDPQLCDRLNGFRHNLLVYLAVLTPVFQATTMQRTCVRSTLWR